MKNCKLSHTRKHEENRELERLKSIIHNSSGYTMSPKDKYDPKPNGDLLEIYMEAVKRCTKKNISFGSIINKLGGKDTLIKNYGSKEYALTTAFIFNEFKAKYPNVKRSNYRNAFIDKLFFMKMERSQLVALLGIEEKWNKIAPLLFKVLANNGFSKWEEAEDDMYNTNDSYIITDVIENYESEYNENLNPVQLKNLICSKYKDDKNNIKFCEKTPENIKEEKSKEFISMPIDNKSRSTQYENLAHVTSEELTWKHIANNVMAVIYEEGYAEKDALLDIADADDPQSNSHIIGELIENSSLENTVDMVKKIKGLLDKNFIKINSHSQELQVIAEAINENNDQCEWAKFKNEHKFIQSLSGGEYCDTSLYQNNETKEKFVILEQNDKSRDSNFDISKDFEKKVNFFQNISGYDKNAKIIKSDNNVSRLVVKFIPGTELDDIFQDPEKYGIQNEEQLLKLIHIALECIDTIHQNGAHEDLHLGNIKLIYEGEKFNLQDKNLKCEALDGGESIDFSNRVEEEISNENIIELVNSDILEFVRAVIENLEIAKKQEKYRNKYQLTSNLLDSLQQKADEDLIIRGNAVSEFETLHLEINENEIKRKLKIMEDELDETQDILTMTENQMKEIKSSKEFYAKVKKTNNGEKSYTQDKKYLYETFTLPKYIIIESTLDAIQEMLTSVEKSIEADKDSEFYTNNIQRIISLQTSLNDKRDKLAEKIDIKSEKINANSGIVQSMFGKFKITISEFINKVLSSFNKGNQHQIENNDTDEFSINKYQLKDHTECTYYSISKQMNQNEIINPDIEIDQNSNNKDTIQSQTIGGFWKSQIPDTAKTIDDESKNGNELQLNK